MVDREAGRGDCQAPKAPPSTDEDAKPRGIYSGWENKGPHIGLSLARTHKAALLYPFSASLLTKFYSKQRVMRCWGLLICTRHHKTVAFKAFSSGFFTKDCKKTSRGRIIDFYFVMKLHMQFYRSSSLPVFPFSLCHRGKLSYFTRAYCKSDKFSQSGWRMEVEKPSGKYIKCN